LMESSTGTEAQSAAAPQADGTESAPVARPPNRWWLWFVLLAAILVVAGVAVERFLDVQRDLKLLREQSEELVTQHRNDQAALRDLKDRLETTSRRTEQLEQQLTLLAGRDLGADAELRRLREQSVLTETDELFTLAIAQLQVSRDPLAAAAALATADARLARLSRAQFGTLRDAVSRDIERLRKAPTVDITGMAIRLDRLVQGVDTWHLLGDPNRRLTNAAPPKAKPEAAPPSHVSWIAREFGEMFRDLVRIRSVDAPEALMLPADQHMLLRTHLRARLLNARQSMLIRNEALFRSDLSDSLNLIGRYFDPADPLVSAAATQLKAMAAVPIDAPLPTLEDSVSALRSLRGAP
jgi:uncharacterized protein HemX